jgi:hypothetical protein
VGVQVLRKRKRGEKEKSLRERERMERKGKLGEKDKSLRERVSLERKRNL